MQKSKITKIPLGTVSKRFQQSKVLDGALSSTLCVYLFPPSIKGKPWGLAVGPKGEVPRFLANLKEVEDGVLESENEARWQLRRVKQFPEKCTWDVYFTASKA